MAKRLILASGSPRRQELLAVLGVAFEVRPSDVAEDDQGGEPPADLALRLARDKVVEVHRRAPSAAVVLGADTVVAYNAESGPVLLAKPADAADARRMLEALSGRAHTVYTGLALASLSEGGGCVDHAVVATDVRFRTLTPAMVDAYLATGEPFDKAGAYGIQGAAAAFVEAVYGDYYNVVGLPLERTRALLARHFPDVRDAPPPPPGLPFAVYDEPLRPAA